MEVRYYHAPVDPVILQVLVNDDFRIDTLLEKKMDAEIRA